MLVFSENFTKWMIAKNIEIYLKTVNVLVALISSNCGKSLLSYIIFFCLSVETSSGFQEKQYVKIVV